MCGRFYIDDETAREIERIVRKIDRQNAKTGEVHPSEPALVLRADQGSMVAEALKWGYESARKNTLVFNARSETVKERPMLSNICSCVKMKYLPVFPNYQILISAHILIKVF